ncbi:MAG: type VII toxin-antitoxin system MntA family adenylyltransferase antitoxin [Deferrisomatales bacterium]
MTRLASQRPEVERVILFGSRARGDADARSDIDLAIDAPRATRRQWLDLSFDLDEIDSLVPVQTVRLGEVSAPLRERILSEGEVWYVREQG